MAERRSAPRLMPATELSARVRAFLPARVVDVSRTGIQLELSSLLRVGITCEVKLSLEGTELRRPATVRRCRATRFGVDENGQKVLFYRAGLEFASMSDEEWAHMEPFLQNAQKAGAGLELDHRHVLEGQSKVEQPETEQRTGPIKVKIDTSRFRT